jgi:hypothetical protein
MSVYFLVHTNDEACPDVSLLLATKETLYELFPS